MEVNQNEMLSAIGSMTFWTMYAMYVKQIIGQTTWQKRQQMHETDLSWESFKYKPRVGEELHVANWLFQGVHPTLFQQLPHQLIGDLITPLIDCRHADIIYEQSHHLAAWRSIGTALALLHATLYSSPRVDTVVCMQVQLLNSCSMRAQLSILAPHQR